MSAWGRCLRWRRSLGTFRSLPAAHRDRQHLLLSQASRHRPDIEHRRNVAARQPRYGPKGPWRMAAWSGKVPLSTAVESPRYAGGDHAANRVAVRYRTSGHGKAGALLEQGGSGIDMTGHRLRSGASRCRHLSTLGPEGKRRASSSGYGLQNCLRHRRCGRDLECRSGIRPLMLPVRPHHPRPSHSWAGGKLHAHIN